jgi:hypothetical protein
MYKIMLANRIVRKILQNYKVNREKFINNKKKYNMMAVKNRNHNMIIKRNFGSSSGYMPPKPDRDPDEFIRGVIAGTILGYWISFYIKKNK